MKYRSTGFATRAGAASDPWIRRLVTNRELGWTAVAQVLLVLQSLVQVKVLTTFLTKAEYGQWALILSFSLLVGMLPFSAFDQGVAKVRGELKSDVDEGIFARVSVIYAAIFTVWAVVIILASVVAGAEGWAVTLPLLFFALTEVFRNAAVSYNNAARKRRIVASHRGWDVVAKTIAMLALASAGLLRTTPLLWSLSLVNAMGLVLFSARFRISTLGGPESVRTLLKSVWAFSWPLAIWALFGWFQPMISRWYLTEWSTPEAVASFAVVVSVSMFAPNFVYTVFASYLLPVLYGRSGPLPRRQYLGMTALFGAVLGVYSLLTIPWAGLLLTVLTDDKYIEMARYIPWVTASTSLNFVAALYASELFRAGATKKLLAPTLAPGILSVTLGFALVQQYGLKGAIATFILGQLIYAGGVCTVTAKHLALERMERK